MEKQLALHEGVRLKPYRCSAGKITIGIGRNIEENGISYPEAQMLLANDISRVLVELSTTFHWFRNLDEVRKRVLVDMCFNLGLSRLMKFRRMLSALELGGFTTASIEMVDSRWARQVGERAKRLAKMMRTGEDDIQ
ncbi:MAG: lysozyme [Magnetococcales bacterium]|nr:lysozyme [Magnetococcales bacterium]